MLALPVIGFIINTALANVGNVFSDSAVWLNTTSKNHFNARLMQGFHHALKLI